MEFNERLDGLQRAILDLFFPRRCPFCGRVVEKALLCDACEKSLPYTGGSAVRRGAFGRCASPLYYEGPVRDAVRQYKFHDKLGGLECFGAMMARCAAEEFSGEFDAVTWVPISARRLRNRGRDQSRLLAGSLCVDWHTMPVRTLKKVVDNPAQSGLPDPAARRANVLGVYEAACPEEIAGRRWLLVDDVCTTGSTLAECVRVLREAGAADVVCLTLATVREK